MPEILLEDNDGIARAVGLLRDGQLVALPTETVYGLAADASDGEAVARIFAAKDRPTFNPLIVHVAEMAQVEALAELNDIARDLTSAFWPGPLTLVLPLRDAHGLSPLVSGGQSTVAVRMPAHPAMRAVLTAFGGPIAAPSANPSGRISPTEAQHVVDGLGDNVAAILDGGSCEVGLESTILAPGTPTILLREGGLPREAIEPLTGPLMSDTTPGTVRAPGQLSSHYAPGAAVVLGGPIPDAAVTIGFGPGKADLTLSESGDLIEAAANLFGTLHAADDLAKSRKASTIHVADIPETGLGRAINDRLRRAAAPRG
ncbi:MAG: L-threonylcarbamoyladenylate synthase [Pseudomonadota bacterium]